MIADCPVCGSPMRAGDWARKAVGEFSTCSHDFVDPLRDLRREAAADEADIREQEHLDEGNDHGDV